jgi:MiaB-like tRNA modifying enzyme
MASVQSKLIKKIVPNAKFLPPQYSYQIDELLNNQNVNFSRKNKTIFPKFYNQITAPISISEGCNLSCSYCITSVARGALVSYPINQIKKDIENALKHGCKEIQLTSQDTAAFGLDIGKDLGDLLKDLSKIKGEYRIRVGMMNPFHLSKNIDLILKGFDNPNIYKFLHIPVQSGDNEILKKMNRHYKIDDFYKIINKFRKKFPEITISTDIIIGFPTETDEQFNRSINLIKKIKPDITNITRFSARPFTKAKNMNGRIPTEIVKERSKKFTKIANEISYKNNRKHLGNKYNILITEQGKNNSYAGRNDFYKPVVLKEETEIGKIVTVKITSTKQTYLVARLI